MTGRQGASPAVDLPVPPLSDSSQAPEDAGSQRHEATVIVVGAGPAGSATATQLARRGIDVLVLEKATFPRDKICGDGLTPRAVKQLIDLGVDISPENGWHRNRGLRVHGGRIEPFDLPWPELESFPNFGLVRPRAELDALLADHAVGHGARLLTGVTVSEPILDERSGRIRGVRAKDGSRYYAPIVVAADGVSSRLGLAMGRERREDRPMGVAVRAYYRSEVMGNTEWMESWLELWEGAPGRSALLPGYGWSFPTGQGVANVGLGMVNTSPAFAHTDYREMMTRWLANTPAEWTLDTEHLEAPIRGAALPMGFNRKPAYSDGLLLVGDAGGMVNPFNGEGIDYALEAAALAGEAISQAIGRGIDTPEAERALAGYVSALKRDLGGYFRLGSIFANLIGHPQVMRVATRYGLPRRRLMDLVLKLLTNSHDGAHGDINDKIITTLSRVAPSA